MEDLLRIQPYISEYLDFHFYETFKYYDTGTLPSDVDNLGKWPMQAKKIWYELWYKIMKYNGE